MQPQYPASIGMVDDLSQLGSSEGGRYARRGGGWDQSGRLLPERTDAGGVPLVYQGVSQRERGAALDRRSLFELGGAGRTRKRADAHPGELGCRLTAPFFLRIMVVSVGG